LRHAEEAFGGTVDEGVPQASRILGDGRLRHALDHGGQELFGPLEDLL
jgi:hypothetical protein